MRVLKVLEEASYGGPHRRTFLVSNYLNNNFSDDTFEILASDGAKRLIEECVANDIPYRTCSISALSKHPIHLLRYILSFPIDTFRIYKQMRQSGADIVHVCGGAWSIKAPIAAKCAGIPFIWHMNDAFQPKVVLSTLKFLVNILKPNGVIYSGLRARDYYKQYFRKNLPSNVIRPPLSDEYGAHAVERNLSNTFTTENLKLVLVGNINTVKGINLVLKAVDTLRLEEIPVELTILGKTKSSQARFRKKLEQDYRHLFDDKSVEIIDSVTDVRAHLQQADIAVCASTTESGPMSVWEYAAMGSVIVSSDVGDVREVLGDSCYIFEPGSVEGLCECIKSAVTNKQEAISKAKAAVDRIQVNFVSRVSIQFHEIYKEVSSARSK